MQSVIPDALDTAITDCALSPVEQALFSLKVILFPRTWLRLARNYVALLHNPIHKEVTMNSTFRFFLALALAGSLAACDSAQEDKAEADAAKAQAEAVAPAADAASATAAQAADNAGSAIATAADATAEAAAAATTEAANNAAAAGHEASAEIKEEAQQTTDAAQAAADAARAKMDDSQNPKK